MSEESLKQRIAELNASEGAIQEKVHYPDKRTYSVEDIHRILGISRSTAYQLIRKKVFKSVKVGKQIRISRSSFDAWLTLPDCQVFKFSLEASFVPLSVFPFPDTLSPRLKPWGQ